jgi:uncharacterized membrane protein HdeD (DUF308 family)
MSCGHGERLETPANSGLKNAQSVVKFGKETAVNKTLGVILIALGLFGLAWGGFTYTTREKVVDIGPIHASRDKTHTVPMPPIFGAIALIGGIVLLAVPKKA